MGEGAVIKVAAFNRVGYIEWCGVAEIWGKKVVFAEMHMFKDRISNPWGREWRFGLN